MPEPSNPTETAAPTASTTAPTATIIEESGTEPAAPRPPSVPATDPASPGPPQERNIYVDRVEIANPLVVHGRARTFENNVSLRARDAKGKLLVETFTTSDGEMGNHNPFRATLWLPRDPGGRVIVEALEYSAKDGSEQSRVAVERPFAVELIDVRLHLPNKDCTGVNPVTRRVPKSIGMARLLLEMLLAEPAPFPREARVQSVNLRDGVLTVDFNERLQNVGGSCAAQMIRASVTETLRQLPSVKRVVITAGGSEKLALQP